MFSDDDEGKDKGALIKFAKKAVVCVLLIVALPSIVPPMMGVEDTIGCWTNEDGCTTNNPILTDDFTRLIQIVLDTVRGGGAVAIIIAGGYRGLQYRFEVLPAKSTTTDESPKN